LSSNLAQAEKEKSELQEQLKTLKEQFAATAASAEKEKAALHKQLQVLSLLALLVQKYKSTNVRNELRHNYVYIYMYVFIYVYVCIYTCVCVCVHIYIYI
jgi:hypothetical protein